MQHHRVNHTECTFNLVYNKKGIAFAEWIDSDKNTQVKKRRMKLVQSSAS